MKLVGAVTFCLLAGSVLAPGPVSLADAEIPVPAFGSVVDVRGLDAAVVVLRGSSVYSLKGGDILFLGDRVFTRSGGSAILQLSGCRADLGEMSFLEVADKNCTVLPSASGVAGIDLAAASGTPVDAAPSLAPLLSTGAVAKAAAGAAAGNKVKGKNIVE